MSAALLFQYVQRVRISQRSASMFHTERLTELSQSEALYCDVYVCIGCVSSECSWDDLERNH